MTKIYIPQLFCSFIRGGLMFFDCVIAFQMPSTTSVLVFISFLISTSFCITIELGNLQSVAVNGKLLCNDKPANNIKVKLYEEEAILDVLLDERFTSEDGTFEMSGSKSEVTTIDPKLNIYHKCNYDGVRFEEAIRYNNPNSFQICVRKISIMIPTEYITNGEKPARTYNIGEINLASKFSGQSTDCFN
ncbi:hypothetical protein CAEBREN_06745 [Caenorhabditis brenneri]|uniref:Uncharacterized protein n=1 Tax=Caenorhabditis brenneri TaxID=135651 RepID=G0N4Y9_CAEBE|nr:hypothetical protein CAEBREN_06745 [Caenorhabditis brenneri]